MQLPTDDRAQAIGILRLFLSLCVGGLIVWIVTTVTNPLFEQANEHGSGEVATQGTAWLQEGVDFLPVMFLLLAFFGMIAYSVYSRDVVR